VASFQLEARQHPEHDQVPNAAASAAARRFVCPKVYRGETLTISAAPAHAARRLGTISGQSEEEYGAY
jgi:hypothetical protein